MSRPKIELVRLTSAETRALPPLNVVQLCVKYTHRRMETYSSLLSRSRAAPTPQAVQPRCPKCVKRRRSCSHLVDGSRASLWDRLITNKAAVKSLENVSGVDRRAEGTKSCENILHVRQQPLAGEGRQRSPLAWCEATRSEEHLAAGTDPQTTAPAELRGAKSHDYLRKYTIDGSGELVPMGLGNLSQSVPGSLRGFWSKSCTMPNMKQCSADAPPPGKPRRSLSSFLKRLHPRLLRASLQGGAPERRPWIVVEFQDVDGDKVDADRASVQSSEDLRTSFSSAQKISLVRSRQSSRTDVEDDMLDNMRQGKVTSQSTTPVSSSSSRIRHSSKNGVGSKGREAGDLSHPPHTGAMYPEKEVLRGPQLTSARIIMDAQNEIRANGSSPDQVDRSTTVLSQKRLQQTHALKASLKSSEVVKQAVRLLSEEERNGHSGSDSTPQKRPSYVGISCSVSGYSNLNRYSSRLKDGQQWSYSRDSSPARGLRSLSRDSSPPLVSPADDDTPGRPSRVSLIKRQLREGGQLTDERGRDGQRAAKPEQPRSVSVDRGYLRQYRLQSDRWRLNGDSPRAPGPTANGTTRHHVQRSTVTTTTAVARNGIAVTTSTERTETLSAGSPGTTDGGVSRSFVQARIERLYGPGALCSGFRRINSGAQNRSLSSRAASECPESGLGGTARVSRRPPPLQMAGDVVQAEMTPPPPSPGLPVFRHLRAEFRQQLPVKGRQRAAPPPADTSPTQTTVPPITAADPPLLADPDRPLSEPDLQERRADQPGHKFIKILDAETTRILAMATRAENDLNSVALSPEVEGKLRAAKGKAQLLIAQKFQQFRGLCEKNIKQPADDPFPTTGDDLQGFWDMVLIQVHHIDTIMAELDTIRQNNWVIPEVTPPPRETSSTTSTPNSKASTPSRRSLPADPAKAEAVRARSAARKRMMEERRRLIEEKRRAAKAMANGDAGGDGVEIFMAEDK